MTVSATLRSYIVFVAIGVLGLSLACAPERRIELETESFTHNDFAANDIDSELGPTFTEGAKRVPLKLNALPDAVRDRVNIVREQRGLEPIELPPITITASDLEINIDKKTMWVSTTVETPDGTQHEFVLEGQFDPTAEQWIANNMLPTNANQRQQRLIQAVAMCLKPRSCNEVAIDFWYDGVDQPIQFIQKANVSGQTPTTFLNGNQSVGSVTKEGRQATQDDGLAVSGSADGVFRNQFETATPGGEAELSADTSRPIQQPTQLQSGVDDRIPLVVPPSPSANRTDVTPIEEYEPALPVLSATSDSDPEKQEQIAQEIADNPETVVEYNDRVAMPAPEPTSNSPRVNTELAAPTRISGNWPNQAFGHHGGGRLENGTLVPRNGTGFFLKDLSRLGNDHAWTTKFLADFQIKVLADVEAKFPGRPRVAVGNFSKPKGGKIVGVSSHQHGLDVDQGFYVRTGEFDGFWSPLAGYQSSKKGARKFSWDDFDFERNWEYLKQIHNTDQDVIIAVFIDRRIKQRLCQYAKEIGDYDPTPGSLPYRVFQSMVNWAGHHHHYHVRAYCPGTVGCSNKLVSLPVSSGCN